MTLVLAVVLLPFALLTFCFALEVLFGLKPLARPHFVSQGIPSATLIVPAHDEERVIRSTLERLLVSASKRAQILLVADNCTDQTATIARELGVEAIERSDPDRRGKGFALDFARQHLKGHPPDVVLIVDADCSIDAKSVSALADACAALQLPCQATNLQQPSPEASPAVQVSTFAFFIKNVIRQRALRRLAGRAHLLGTGMALPWDVFASAELATSNIVEDIKLGQELADRGSPPQFLEEAAVWSRAESDANTIAQRKRWEGGFLQNAIRTGPRLLGRSFARRDIRLAWAAIDLMIPPFALLILLDVLALAVAALVSWLAAAQFWPFLTLCGALALAFVALGLAWVKGGSTFVSLKSLAQAPLYVLWKLPMYLGLARRGAPKQWVRTSR